VNLIGRQGLLQRGDQLAAQLGRGVRFRRRACDAAQRGLGASRASA
jgi:hypothetical protein